ncbi:sodium:solute symporter family transporter [Haloplanus halophilus]|uniref:sodium:solute symporter family transporter n=1 Tax=Haloplanus halophilus TaxID=2949993 RepID=UPI00203BE550|nr:sodium:proline symporter [Haloplanus sp. GDY1]
MVSTAPLLGLLTVVLLAFAALGAWYARGRIETVEDYITARDSAGGGTLTATVVASSMGAWILFSPAEAGAAFGGITAVAGYAAGSALALAAFAVVGPRIRDLLPRGHSLTEYAYARYGSAMYAYVLVVSVAYMFVFLAAEFTGIASALSLIAGVPGWQTATVVGVTVLAYTGYGGLRASIVTDTVQTLLVLPLLIVSVVVTILALGGTDAAHAAIVDSSPELLTVGSATGLEFGAYVVVAIVGAEMLNQAWWQRVYAASDERTLRRAFLVAAVAVVPMVFLAGAFGPVAVGLGLVQAPADASVSFFLVVTDVLPDAAVIAVAVLAVLLVVSSADTLFNAIASVVTADLPRLLDVSGDRLTATARGVTVVVAAAATVVGAQGYSVLTLFLLADLLAAATFVPLLHGLFSPRATSAGALTASAVALVVGLAFFPPARGVLPLATLPAATYFRAFLGAAAVSTTLTVAAARLGDERFDLDDLDREIRRLDDEPATDGSGGERR